MKIKGVVLDMDGLMFDTENLTYKLQHEIFEKNFGINYTLDQYKMTIGKRTEDLLSFFTSLCGEDFDYEAFRIMCRKAYTDYTDKYGVPIKDGLFELLDYLKEHKIKTALSTSTTKKSAERTLRISGALHYFDALICAEDVEHGKPHPEPFEKAAKALSLKPSECVALEDSLNGIKSAYAAGLIPIMVPDLIEPTEEIRPMCRFILTDLAQVINIFDKI
ncbi:MAG: HAD family phosphatase [Ruminococcus sp.]|nr:HAD family phosphatase [Ruminococcus sp.]